jgi:IS30 family transposase
MHTAVPRTSISQKSTIGHWEEDIVIDRIDNEKSLPKNLIARHMQAGVADVGIVPE